VGDNSSDSDAPPPDEELLGNASAISRRTLEKISAEFRSFDAYSRIWITLREEKSLG